MRSGNSIAIGLVMLMLFTGNADAATEKKEFIAKVDPDGVQRVELLAGSYFFNPNHVVVRVNVPVEMKVTLESGVIPHDIVFAAPDAGIDLAAELGGEPKTLRFTPTKTGQFAFYCSKKLLFFESHREKGMVGTLEVREQ